MALSIHAEKIAQLSPEARAQLLDRLRSAHIEPVDGSNHSVPTPVPEATDSDVVVLGGGVAGLTLALQLRRADSTVQVMVVEKAQHPVAETTHKVGESTVEIAAHYLRDILDLRDHLERDQVRKFGLRMFFGSGSLDLAARRELASSTFPLHATYQLDRGRLENELARRCRAEGVDFRTGAVTAVELCSDRPHRVAVRTAQGLEEVTTTWVIDATGRSRHLSRAMDIAKVEVGHRASSAWLRIGREIDIASFSTDSEWQARPFEGERAMSTVHLMGDGYWVWLIRLASGCTSVGIVASEEHHSFDSFNTLERALGWLRAHEPDVAKEVEDHIEDVRDFRVMRNYSYGAQQVFCGHDRWALTGEAGVFLDPLYSPGLDHIAIANNLIADLVLRHRAGEDVRGVAEIHDTMFRRIAEIWLAIYEGQYALLGNATVMTSKVIWDTAFYWGVFGTLFFADRLRTASSMPSVVENLNDFTELSNRVQAFFREWCSVETDEPHGDYVDLYTHLNFMVSLHESMGQPLDDADFAARFAEHLELFKQLAGQVVDRVIRNIAERSPSDAELQVVHTWQTDPVLTAARRTYRTRQRSHPTSDGWLPPNAPPAPATGRDTHQSSQTVGDPSNGEDEHAHALVPVHSA